MKKLFTFFLVPVLALAINVNDIKVSQATKASPPSYIDRIFAPVNLGVWGFDSVGQPVAFTLGTNLSITGTTLNASGGGLIASITGTANEVTVSPTTGAVVISLPSALTFTSKTITGGDYRNINSLAMGTSSIPAGNTSLVTRTDTSGSSVMSDFILNTTAPSTSDSASVRAVIRQLGSGNTSLRAGEFQSLRGTGASSNGTWGVEIGVHSQVSSSLDNGNVGAYIASSHTGWLASGIRNNTGILLGGEDGWNNYLLCYDVDGATVNYGIDRYGDTSVINTSRDIFYNILSSGLTNFRFGINSSGLTNSYGVVPNAAYLGTSNGAPIVLVYASTPVGIVSATGLNSMDIGQTTPGLGSFTMGSFAQSPATTSSSTNSLLSSLQTPAIAGNSLTMFNGGSFQSNIGSGETFNYNQVDGSFSSAKNSGSGTVANLFGNQNQSLQLGSNTVTNLYGLYNLSSTQGSVSGNVTNMVGSWCDVSADTSYSGTATMMAGLVGRLIHRSGTVTTAYGIYLPDMLGASTPATTYGIYIGTNRGSTKYAIFSADAAAPVRIAGGITTTSASAGLGYGTGAGGTVTQSTDKTTGVTLNKTTGQITMNSAALAASTSVGFTVTDSAATSTDTVIVNIGSGATANSYTVTVDAVGSGSFHVHLRNVSGGSLSEALVLNFCVIKGASS